MRGMPFIHVLALEDQWLVEQVMERLRDKAYGTGFSRMSRQEQNVYLVSQIDGEIENGGMDQFFTNSAGNCATRTLAALDEIGLTDCSKLLRRVIELFPDAGPSEDRSTRFDQLDALGARRNRFDDGDEDWGVNVKIVAAYVRQHARSFSLPP